MRHISMMIVMLQVIFSVYASPSPEPRQRNSRASSSSEGLLEYLRAEEAEARNRQRIAAEVRAFFASIDRQTGRRASTSRASTSRESTSHEQETDHEQETESRFSSPPSSGGSYAQSVLGETRRRPVHVLGAPSREARRQRFLHPDPRAQQISGAHLTGSALVLYLAAFGSAERDTTPAQE